MIKPAKTSHQLRILAQQIEDKTAPDFALVVLNDDRTVSRAVRYMDGYNELVGALESLKLDILTGEIE